MKVALLSESSADETAVRILVDALLGKQTEPIALSLRSRGWPSVLRVLPAALTQLHYHTNAEALVVVVDSDRSPAHQHSHEAPDAADRQCRLCLLREAVAQTLRNVRAVAGKPPVKMAIGLAVPAIEAWYCCGPLSYAAEAVLIKRPLSEITQVKLDLKRAAYGTDRPSIELQTRRAAEEAQRLARDLSLLEAFFPAGFGALARDVRNW